jgi:hypothetical protein
MGLSVPSLPPRVTGLPCLAEMPESTLRRSSVSVMRTTCTDWLRHRRDANCTASFHVGNFKLRNLFDTAAISRQMQFIPLYTNELEDLRMNWEKKIEEGRYTNEFEDIRMNWEKN